MASKVKAKDHLSAARNSALSAKNRLKVPYAGDPFRAVYDANPVVRRDRVQEAMRYTQQARAQLQDALEELSGLWADLDRKATEAQVRQDIEEARS